MSVIYLSWFPRKTVEWPYPIAVDFDNPFTRTHASKFPTQDCEGGGGGGEPTGPTAPLTKTNRGMN